MKPQHVNPQEAVQIHQVRGHSNLFGSQEGLVSFDALTSEQEQKQDNYSSRAFIC